MDTQIDSGADRHTVSQLMLGVDNIYCRVPARRGLQRTARAATRLGARDPLVRPQVDQTYRGASNNRQAR